MKKVLVVLAALSLVFVQNLVPVFAAEANSVDVATGEEFLNALDGGSYEINITSNLTIDFSSARKLHDEFIVVTNPKVINGGNHTITFTGEMSEKYSSVLQFRNSVTLKDLTIYAPNKVHSTDKTKNQYTPTILSFFSSVSNESQTIDISNVTVRTAEGSNNPQVAVNVATKDASVTFNQLFIDGGRLFFDGGAVGTVKIVDSVISQANVPFVDGYGDQIVTFKGASSSNVTLDVSKSLLFVDLDKVTDDFSSTLQRLKDNGFGLVEVQDAIPTSLTDVTVFTADGFMQLIKNPSINKISLNNDILDLVYTDHATNKSFVSVAHNLTIEGNNHKLGFDFDSKMPGVSVPVFGFSNDVTLRNLSLYAPDKAVVSEGKLYYTPTLLSFSGADKKVLLENVDLNVAVGSKNPQVALYIYNKGTSEVTLDGVNVPSGRIFVNQSATGTLAFKNTVISQETVMIKDSNSDEIFALNGSAITVTANNTRFVVNPFHLNTQAYLVSFLFDFAKARGIDLDISLNDSIVYKNANVQLTTGQTVKLTDVSELFGLINSDTTHWSNIHVQSGYVKDGYLVTDKAGSFDVSADYGFTFEDKFYSVESFNFKVTVTDEPQTEIVGVGDISDTINPDKIEVSFDPDQFEAPVSAFKFSLPTLSSDLETSLSKLLNTMVDAKLQINQFLVLNISPVDAQGNKLQVLNGLVDITIPVPTGLDSTKPFAIFHVNADGSLTQLKHVFDNGLITFRASEFSDFVIANVVERVEPVNPEVPTPTDPEVPTPTDPEVPTPTNPEAPTPTNPAAPTPDDSNALPGAGLVSPSIYGYALSGLGVLTIAIGNRKRRNHK